MSKERAAQLVEAGIWLKLSGDQEGARKLFERALKLDPGNEKATQLLASAPAAPPPSAPPADAPAGEAMPPPPPAPPAPERTDDATGANPFERPREAAPPSATEVGWGLATGFAPNPATPAAAPAPLQVNLEDDWGRFTGASTPVPAQAPADQAAFVPVSSDAAARMGTSGAEAAAPRHTLVQFNVADAAAQPAPRNTLVQFTVADLPAENRPPAPRNTLVQFTVDDAPLSMAPPRATPADFTLPPLADAPLALAEPAQPNTAEPVDTAALTDTSAPAATAGMWDGPAQGGERERTAPPEADAGWRFSDSGVAASPAAWDLAPSPQSTPSQPVLDAVRELEPAPEVVAVPVPPPPVPDAEPVSSAPVFSESPAPGAVPTFDSPPPTAGAMFAALPAPAPSGPESRGVQADLSSRDALFGTAGEVPAPAPAPSEPAWAWSASVPPPDTTPAEWAAPPEPRPSPSLAPAAESAWDQRSDPGVKLPVVPGRDRALDLISSDSKISRPPEARSEALQQILRNARNLLDLDDHTGAMELIVKAQALAPDDLEVQVLRERSERTLLTMLESKLGALATVPRVLLKDDEIIWLNLDHRAGFVLAQIDGSVTFDDLFSVSGMTRLDTARILAQLVDEGVISRG